MWKHEWPETNDVSYDAKCEVGPIEHNTSVSANVWYDKLSIKMTIKERHNVGNLTQSHSSSQNSLRK
jgi:hypothetical protein